MMIGDALQNTATNNSSLRLGRSGYSLQYCQETIYLFLLGIVRNWPPEEVLLEFKRLFVLYADSTSSEVMRALYEIVFSNNEEEFKNTLKRSCYILVNNWDASRHYKPIQDLVLLFEDPAINRQTSSPISKRLRFWLNDFVKSKDYEELKLFASRYDETTPGPWTARYTSYLLVPQYIDLSNPIEQREAARALSKQLKDRFKFELAMYIARSQSHSHNGNLPKNPTVLGDEVIRLIKAIVAKRGPFSYANLAHIFISQTQNLTYQQFKKCFQRYLLFSVESQEFIDTLQVRLSEKLQPLYESHDQEPVNNALILRTCNRVIEFLTTEDHEEPSPLFILLLSKGNPITLAISLLKIILVCRHARTHLEARIAELIQYYQHYPEDECAWVVNFLEVFNVTFTIHTENVQYNLIKMQLDDPEQPAFPENIFDPDRYRIFSQLRNTPQLEMFPDFTDYEVDGSPESPIEPSSKPA